jgi:hypothetical protein
MTATPERLRELAAVVTAPDGTRSLVDRKSVV